MKPLVSKKNWETKNGPTTCSHANFLASLVSTKGQDIGFTVCRDCGEVKVKHRNPLSSAEIKLLKLLNAQED
jgi:hypothetical protein